MTMRCAWFDLTEGIQKKHVTIGKRWHQKGDADISLHEHAPLRSTLIKLCGVAPVMYVVDRILLAS
jgi:hypothetical protein